MTKRGSTPSKALIRKQWAGWLVGMGKFDSVTEVMEADYCWACGWTNSDKDDWTEKAHILAFAEGGNNDPSNYHLLCYWCHLSSEMLSGEEYMNWFFGRNIETLLKDVLNKELQRESRSQRAKRSIEIAKKNGTYKGGYRSPLPKELADRIVSERRAGNGPVKIAKMLTAEGIKTVRGKDVWQAATIQLVLDRSGETFEPLINKDADKMHGTKTMYSYGCRCQLCTESIRIYTADWRKRNKRVTTITTL